MDAQTIRYAKCIYCNLIIALFHNHLQKQQSIHHRDSPLIIWMETNNVTSQLVSHCCTFFLYLKLITVWGTLINCNQNSELSSTTPDRSSAKVTDRTNPPILSRLGSDRLDDSRCKKKTAAATDHDRLTEPKRIVIKISLSGWQHAIELLSVRTVRSDHGVVVGMTVRAKNLTLIMPKKPSKPPPHHATSVAHPSIMNEWVE